MTALPYGTRGRNLYLLKSPEFDVQVATSSLAQLGVALAAAGPPIVLWDTSDLDYWSTWCDHVAIVAGLDLVTIALNDPYFDTAPQQAPLASFQEAWAANENLAAFIPPQP